MLFNYQITNKRVYNNNRPVSEVLFGIQRVLIEYGKKH